MRADPEELTPIEHRTLADLVTVRIRDAIIEGKLKPGQRLTEPMLAQHLDVSRSPVREALSRLKYQGLVVGSSTSYVWNPTELDVDEILSLRTTLDCLADEWVIRTERLTQEDYADLQSRIDDLRKRIEKPDTLSVTAVVTADEAFHEIIYRRSGHSRLVHLWHQMLSQRRALLHTCLAASDVVAFASEVAAYQQSVLDGLRCGDLESLQRERRLLGADRARQIKSTLSVRPSAQESLTR